MIWLVTRHPGALEWAFAEGLVWDVHVPHLDPAVVRSGDDVYGTLPAHQAAEICARGARYHHLCIDLPPESRGQELNAGRLRELSARFVRLDIRSIDE